jgi:hypothetical protein
MKKTALFALALATAVGAVAGSAVLPATAFAKDDPVKIKEKRDAFRKKQEEAGVICYLDLVYGVERGPKEKPKIDSRWAKEALNTDATEQKGMQFHILFSDSKFPEGSSIRMHIHKFVQKTGTSKGVYSFDNAGKQVDVADKQGMVEGFYAEKTKVFKELVKDRLVPTKKVKVGPADLTCSVVGTNPESSKRERFDVYVWMAPNTTYLCLVIYSGVCQEKSEAFEEKVEEVLKAHKELKAPD